MIRNNDKYFQNGINVNLVKVEDDFLDMRTYERGVEDETLSCGSGVAATALAIAYANKIDNSILLKQEEVSGKLNLIAVKIALIKYFFQAQQSLFLVEIMICNIFS